MTYGTINSMKAKPGRRDEVVAILLSGADGLRAAGCHLYVVGTAADDDVTVWISEVWESREHHEASLQLPETREAISAAMPMLAGEFTSQEVRVQGGVGV
ncbi:antibiotic biosynthesis monooxygenase [Streptomonospora sp. S1-112]|uniref:Antibiotic biosynthesis monooxygenase n=1 Tax=Streptomonospora mangrovi TaxID=2883123 RepID=A0A9X3NXR0_9ACTN|nr:putative quinol monooxygenase [Streptomonospora mangrovi]MDA0566286.1 antibiotic biosynthesis monooxygenase [Streptomonospora mangrovi]